MPEIWNAFLCRRRPVTDRPIPCFFKSRYLPHCLLEKRRGLGRISLYQIGQKTTSFAKCLHRSLPNRNCLPIWQTFVLSWRGNYSIDPRESGIRITRKTAGLSQLFFLLTIFFLDREKDRKADSFFPFLPNSNFCLVYLDIAFAMESPIPYPPVTRERDWSAQ